MDQLNTPRAARDQSGNVVWRWESDAFGSTAPTANAGVVVNLRFPGQYYDQQSGLNYNANRDYDPSSGRYVESEPIGLRGGVNTYAYVNGNPVSRVDPSGLDVTIAINRTTYTSNSIVGTINVTSTVTNKSFSGYTLENASPPNANLPVPPGTYSAFVRTDYTPNRIQLNNVPNASGVQIHKGNTPSNVIGCFAAGSSASTDFVGGSANAMSNINNIISTDGTGNINVMVTGSTTRP